MPETERVLILAPIGRDAALIAHTLQQAKLDAVPCAAFQDLLANLREGAGTAIIAEEALTEHTAALRDWCDSQPTWSDFPFIVLMASGGDVPPFRAIGNVTLLERPLRGISLISAVESALRARRRQYETQAAIAERYEATSLLARQAEELTRSNADLQQFAYVTSHDLQEPLRTIHTYSQLLQRRYSDQLDSDADEYLEYIANGARRMQKMIEDLLAYSRVVNSEPRTFSAVDMNGVAEWTISNLEASVFDSKATIEFQNLPVVWGDQIQLIQLVQNLLSNAIKYRDKVRPLEIHITAERTGDQYVVRVTDNGEGIAPQYHDRIFDMFKRLHGRDVPGTGIGLTICRKIVERHGGKLWVESEAGMGSTFLFTLKAGE